MKQIFLCIKLLFSIALIVFFLFKIDLSSIKNIIFTLSGAKALILASIILILQSCIAGLRLPFILSMYNHFADKWNAIRTWFIGSFFSQTMISFIGGDAIRILTLKRSGIPTRTAASAILLDRVMGFTALIFIFLSVIPFLLDIISSQTMRYGVLSLAFLCSIMFISFIFLSKVPARLREIKYLGLFFDITSNSRYLFLSWKSTIIAFFISLFIQISNSLVIYLIFKFFGEQISFSWCIILSTPAMLISMLPISIAGWGVRETAMITGFSFLGVSEDLILAVSVTFGIAVFISSIPGLVLFLFEKTNLKDTVVDNGSLA